MLKQTEIPGTVSASRPFNPFPTESSPYRDSRNTSSERPRSNENEAPPQSGNNSDTQATSPQTEIIRLLDKASAVTTINNLGIEDLRFLNRLIVDRIKLLINAKQKAALYKFIPGHRVRFTSSAGELKTGTVIKINQKTISVAVDGDPGWWNVGPGLLTRID